MSEANRVVERLTWNLQSLLQALRAPFHTESRYLSERHERLYRLMSKTSTGSGAELDRILATYRLHA